MSTLKEDQLFERYRIVRYLGSGAAGESYEAEDTVLLRKVTLKLIHPWSMLPDSARRQFFREMQGISILTHPYLASVLDYGEINSQLYVARRYVTSSSLLGNEGRLWFHPPLNIPDAIRYGHQLAQTLQHIHNQGCLHGALTFSNILVLRGPNVENEPDYAPFLLADVGLTNFVRRFGQPQNQLLPITAAPEQFGQRVTPASDQFALAVLLYFWLAGRPPYLGTPEEIEHLKLTETITPLSLLNPTVTVEQDGILLRALTVYPEDRYPSVLSFADALLSTLPPKLEPVPEIEPVIQPEFTALMESPAEEESISETEPEPEFASPVEITPVEEPEAEPELTAPAASTPMEEPVLESTAPIESLSEEEPGPKTEPEPEFASPIELIPVNEPVLELAAEVESLPQTQPIASIEEETLVETGAAPEVDLLPQIQFTPIPVTEESSQVDAVPSPEFDLIPQTDPVLFIEPAAEPAPQPEYLAEPEMEPGAPADTTSSSAPGLLPSAEPATNIDAETVPQFLQQDPQTTPAPQPVPAPQPAPQPIPVPEPATQPSHEPATEPVPQTVPDVPQPMPEPDVPQPTPDPIPQPRPDIPQPPSQPDVPQPAPNPIPQPVPDVPQPMPEPNVPQPAPQPLPQAEFSPVEELSSNQEPPPDSQEEQQINTVRLIISSPYAEEPYEFTLEGDEITLGRAGSSDILLDQDNLTSRHHALLRHENNHYVIYDRRSANGVFVNGQQINAEIGCELVDGDHISIGNYELIFRFAPVLSMAPG